MLVFTFQQVAGCRSEACVSGVLIVTALSLSIQLQFCFHYRRRFFLYYPLLLILLDPFDPCVGVAWAAGVGGYSLTVVLFVTLCHSLSLSSRSWPQTGPCRGRRAHTARPEAELVSKAGDPPFSSICDGGLP